MSEFRIENRGDGKIAIYTPYDKKFVQAIKAIGSARWTGEAWTVPTDYIDDVRIIMKDIYGRDDQDAGESVDCEIEFLYDYYERKAAVVMFGKTIARAWGRDSGAKVGDDVMLVDGSIGSGGSRANWETCVYKGAKFIVKNVPKARFEKEKSDYQEEYGIDTKITIISEKIDKDALLEEKARLERRLAEIEKMLNTENEKGVTE